MIGYLVTDELERMWKEAVVSRFEVLPRNVSEKNEENFRIVGVRTGDQASSRPRHSSSG
jgi:hypothetical protein